MVVGNLNSVASMLDSSSSQATSAGQVTSVIGPEGKPITLADLPPPNTKRWVIRRKAEVVAAVRGGLLTLEQACERYTLSVEEFLSWQSAIEAHGMPGLRATRVQLYRPTPKEAGGKTGTNN